MNEYIVKVKGDTEFKGTARQIVNSLNHQSLTPASNNSQYMKDVSNRISQFTAFPIRTNSCDNFLRDLNTFGLLMLKPLNMPQIKNDK